ncbi:MAG: sigma-70 family RNA polymerase sigma factor [Bacteroidota bacterium]
MDYITGIRSSDKAVLTEIYRLFQPRIINLVVKNSGTEQEGMDIFQDALVVIFKKADSPDFQLKSTFYNYLYGVSRFLWLRQLKKKHRQTVTFDDVEGYITEPEIVQLIEAEEKRKFFQSKLLLLGPSCQKTLQLFFDGFSLKKIGEALGYTEHYVKRKKYKCKEQLIQMIKEDPRFSEFKEIG